MSLKQRLGLTSDPLFLMDGSAFIYRGFFANKSMQRSDGFPTSALVVTTRVLLRILREERPAHFLFVKDGPGRNFRHELFPRYKANREAMPDDLQCQIDPILRMVRALGVPVEISQGCEADDCIASLAGRFSPQLPVVIVSGDKDLKQCLGPQVFMWDPAAREEKLLTAEGLEAESGVTPSQWPDFQALVGDASDNIPGVPGIGPKTAQKIIAVCPSLEDIRDHFSLLPPKLQDKLAGHLEDMFLWRRLTLLSRGECAGLSLDDLRVSPLDAARCAALADEFELHALRREMASLARTQGAAGRAGARAEPLPAGEAAAGAGVAGTLPLLELAAEPQSPSVGSVSALPPCAGQDVALLWPEGRGAAPQLAVAQGESLRWTGPPETLLAWMAPARRVVTADAKVLLEAASGGGGAPGEGLPLRFFDLGLAAYLLNPEEGDYGWPRLALRWGAPLRDADGGPGPAALALRMAAVLERRLGETGLLPLYGTLELPLTPVLAAMERRGVAIDLTAFRAFLDDVQREITQLTQAVYAEAGTTFNIRSAQQLGELLFQTLRLAAPRKTRGGQPSTSQEALEKLSGAHPVVERILQFRKLEKMRSTYLAPLPRLVDAQGRIHTTFNQKATATGRLSSSNPNLQNIPVRGPLGKRMRACFIAPPGTLLVSADYSQVELRVLAHMSRDPALLDAFRRGEDIHARTAALIYECAPEDVSPDQRRAAKTINFGLIYGMGAQKLARELHISTVEARDFIARYFARLTGLKAFYEAVEAGAGRQGFVTTLGGRRRLLPDIRSSNGQDYAQARRQAINTVIQGSAADIIKMAMLAVAHDAGLRRMQARLLLQVHDELLLEVPQEHAAAAGARVAELMEAVRPGGEALAVPLRVDWGMGRDWGVAH